MQVLETPNRPLGAVLIIHSWWGLTDSFRQYGNALAAAGFVTGLADLFDGRVAKTVAQARALRGRPRRTPMYKSLAADIGALRCAGRGDLKVGVVGFSMGGHWAVWLSQRPEYGISATVLYYAARGGSFDQSQADILAHFAEKDDWVPPNARKNMERAISKSSCAYQSHHYPGTTHWFAESDRSAEFDAPSARQALERDIEFLRATLAS
ncbi:dienelactone hydrolase family protein [Maribius pontilimi]|uniref:Dienelactone hydrolase family protein n=1 Tax=Palleronia pontilimi TaxID=1964209 RepID=A0A934ME60_9RHOB|nr:dienelactone hydrolase family protein [Palleronia pontilimi]MBJ3764658.1 dienelactone hydrolase family protein [Palleronia pontilimi]